MRGKKLCSQKQQLMWTRNRGLGGKSKGPPDVFKGGGTSIVPRGVENRM